MSAIKENQFVGAWWEVRLDWEEMLLSSGHFSLAPLGRRERQSCWEVAMPVISLASCCVPKMGHSGRLFLSELAALVHL